MAVVIGKFNNIDNARNVVERLIENGFSRNDIDLVKVSANYLVDPANNPSDTGSEYNITTGFINSLIDSGVPIPAANHYAQLLTQGTILVVVNTDEILVVRAAEIIRAKLALDIGSSLKSDQSIAVYGDQPSLSKAVNTIRSEISDNLKNDINAENIDNEIIEETDLINPSLTDNINVSNISNSEGVIKSDSDYLVQESNHLLGTTAAPDQSIISSTAPISGSPITTGAEAISPTPIVPIVASNEIHTELDTNSIPQTSSTREVQQSSSFYHREIDEQFVVPTDLVRLNELSDFEIATGEPDPRGWELLGADDERLGVIEGLLASPSHQKVFFAIVNCGGWLPDKLFALPLVDIDFNDVTGTAVAPYGAEMFKNAPNFSPDQDNDLQLHYQYWRNTGTNTKARTAGTNE